MDGKIFEDGKIWNFWEDDGIREKISEREIFLGIFGGVKKFLGDFWGGGKNFLEEFFGRGKILVDFWERE